MFGCKTLGLCIRLLFGTMLSMTGGLQRVAQSAHVVELSSVAAAVQQAAATAAKGTDRLAVCHGFGIDGEKAAKVALSTSLRARENRFMKWNAAACLFTL